MKTRKVPAVKVGPTIMIGKKISFSTRNFKPNQKPRRKSVDCDVEFKHFVTDDTTDATLLEDYTGTICKDIIGINPDDLKLPQFTILLKKGDTMNSYRFKIESTNHKLDKSSTVSSKSGRHKAEYMNITDLTICSILLEEKNIFNNKHFDILKQLKLNEIITPDGYLEIEES